MQLSGFEVRTWSLGELVVKQFLAWGFRKWNQGPKSNTAMDDGLIRVSFVFCSGFRV